MAGGRSSAIAWLPVLRSTAVEGDELSSAGNLSHPKNTLPWERTRLEVLVRERTGCGASDVGGQPGFPIDRKSVV